MLDLFRPVMYQKNVYDVNYSKLKKMGVKCILFDLDNTISPAKERNYYENIQKLFNKLKKDFIIVIFSNNFPKRVKSFSEYYGVDCAFLSLKPFMYKYKQIIKKYNLKPSEIATIGDQLVTDIMGGNKMKMITILVEPMCDIDEKETWLNRKIELRVFKKFKEKDILIKGRYYD